jgi:hypothetical protein
MNDEETECARSRFDENVSLGSVKRSLLCCLLTNSMRKVRAVLLGTQGGAHAPDSKRGTLMTPSVLRPVD